MTAAGGVLGLMQSAAYQDTSGLTELNILVLGTAWCAILLARAWLSFRHLQAGRIPLHSPPD
jgi:hypothetical protein